MLKTTTCRHFNGLINDCCEAGIRYAQIKQRSGLTDPPMDQWAYPCSERMQRGLPLTCESASFPTPEEERADRERLERALMERIAKIKAGVCPDCDQPMAKRQVGRCVYATPCWHRLYQGKLASETRA